MLNRIFYSLGQTLSVKRRDWLGVLRVSLFLLLVYSATATANSQGSDELVNGGFENLLKDGRPQGWLYLNKAKDVMTFKTDRAHDGRRCMRIDSVPEGWAAMSQVVGSGKLSDFQGQWTLGCWIATTDLKAGTVTVKGQDMVAHLPVVAFWTSTASGHNGPIFSLTPKSGTNDWTYYELTVTEAMVQQAIKGSSQPPVTWALRVNAYHTMGTMYVDDLSWQRVSHDWMSAVMQRSNYTQGDTLGHVQVTFDTQKQAMPAQGTLTVEVKRGQEVVWSQLIKPSAKFTAQWPMSDLTPGAYQLSLVLQDGDGAVVSSQKLPFTVSSDPFAE